MITNTNTFGFKLAISAIEQLRLHDIDYATNYLIRALRLSNAVYWEQLAIADTFKALCKAAGVLL